MTTTSHRGGLARPPMLRRRTELAGFERRKLAGEPPKALGAAGRVVAVRSALRGATRVPPG
jgi:hypothetical protein